MITKNVLASALEGIQDRKLMGLNFVNHLENWGSSYSIEVHRIEKTGVSASDFILNSFLCLDEGDYCEDIRDLEEIAGDCQPREIDGNITARVNEKTRNRIAFIFEELGEVNSAVELFDEWNRYSVVMETADDFVAVFALIPE